MPVASVTDRRAVLHVTEPVDGGVARCVLDLVADQAGRGWRVGVASPADAAFTGALEAAGAEHVAWRVPARPIAHRRLDPPVRRLAGELRPLRRTLLGWQPDVVHLHSSLAGLTGRLALRRARPTVFQPHGWSFQAVTGVVRSGAIAWERLATRWTDAIVYVSDDERRLGEGAGVRDIGRVVPNGVDVEALTAATAEDLRAARERLGLPGGPLVLCLGNVRHAKGQDVLLDAWPGVLRRVPAARLVLVGDGPDRPALERRRADGVTFAGPRSDAGDWLAAADVVAIPSRSEAMSLVLLEAMARGRSVVATDVPGAREALGEAGAVVPIEAPAALAEALVERLLDPALAAGEGQTGRSRAERYFDIRRTSELVSGVYDEVIAAATA